MYFLLASTGTASVAWFVLLTGVILSFYGGGFSTVPAYLKDLFGTIQVGAIHGRLLTAWSVAGVAGPLIVNAIADHQTAAGKSGADLYTVSLYIMVGVLVVGFIANLLIRPVNERFHEPIDGRAAVLPRGARPRRDAHDGEELGHGHIRNACDPAVDAGRGRARVRRDQHDQPGGGPVRRLSGRVVLVTGPRTASRDARHRRLCACRRRFIASARCARRTAASTWRSTATACCGSPATREDPISRGYICPKAAALADLYADPDRLRRPVRRVGSEWEEIGWDEALDMAADGLRAVQRRHGDDAVATYFGNPSAHTMAVLSGLSLRHVLDTRNHYSATSADQLPQHLTSAEMFGNLALFPIPDIDRTDYMLVLGANPSVSNGSLMTAPGARHRLRAIVARGGTRRGRGPAPHRDRGARLRARRDRARRRSLPAARDAARAVRGGPHAARPPRRATPTGSPRSRRLPRTGRSRAPRRSRASTRRRSQRLAREFADAERAVAYGRVGVCQQRTGSLTHWLINVLNAVTGNLDVPGGAMFPNPAFDVGAVLKRARLLGFGDHGRHTQRVSGLPEMNGELPVAGLADEITTPGEGQVRGMLIFAGNPVLSTPGGARLEEALATLEWCVAVDMYVTETTRHANVILPPVSTLERSDIDVVMPLVSVRNHIRYSPAAVPKPKDGREDWQILTALTSRLGRGVGRRAEAAVASLPRRSRHPSGSSTSASRSGRTASCGAARSRA